MNPMLITGGQGVAGSNLVSPPWGSRGFFRHEPGFSPCSALHGFGGQQLRATGGFFWGLSCGFAGNVPFGARNESPAVGLPV